MGMRGLWRGCLLLCLLAGNAVAHDFGDNTTSGGPPDDPDPPPCQKNAGQCCNDPGSKAGDPIETHDGGFYASYADLTHGVVYPIRLVRHYDSRAEFDSALGYGWAFEHDKRLFKYPDGSIVIRAGCGRRDHFVQTGGAFVTPRDASQGTLTELDNGRFEYRYPTGDSDFFDTDGRLEAVENRAGQRHEFSYDPRGRLPLVGTSPRSVNPNKPMVVAYQPRLTQIQERGTNGVLTGYAVNFEYDDTTGRLDRIVASDGRTIDYGHDAFEGSTRGNLRTVAGLENYVQGFGYEDPINKHLLTGIVDGIDAAPVVNTYDDQGRVTRQVHGGSTMLLNYVALGTTEVTEIVTNAAGQELQRRLTKFLFDEAGYLTTRIDPAGNERRNIYNAAKDRTRTEEWEKGTDGTLSLLKATDYTYNGQAQPLTETVTLDTGEVVTKTWTYDHNWIASESVQSSASPQMFRTEYTFVRDGQGVPVNIATVKRRHDDGSFATTTYTYCSAAEAGAPDSACPDVRLVKQIDGPRTDVADVVTRTYYGTTDISGCGQPTGPCHHRGSPRQEVNALGQAVEYLRYDAAGHPTRVRDQNGVITAMTYHPRGWLLEQAVLGPDDAVTTDDAITRHQYDPRGNLTRTEQPDGSYLVFVYDTRNRLTEVHDPDGGKLRYTLDSQGNRLKEETVDAGNTLRRSLSRTFDLFDRTATEASAQRPPTELNYDGAGRQTRIIDPREVETRHSYDDLDRLVHTMADVGGIAATTQFGYDAVGNLRQVTDPKGLPTTYLYNTWNQLVELDSPDTGTTTYGYDPAGNRTRQTDARNETALYTYDAVNRLTGIEYSSDSALNVAYVYDTIPTVCEPAETFGVGRLGTMTDGSGSTQYCYDRFGNVVRKVQISAGTTLTLRYVYEHGRHLQAILYPDGTTVDYGRDAQGRIEEVGVALQGDVRRVLVSGASYAPFGPSTGWTYGIGRQLVRQHDQSYWPTAITDSAPGGLDLGYRYDDAGNLTSLHTGDLAEPPRMRFDYDPLNRLHQARDGASGSVNQRYDYDATGNRTTLTDAGGPQPYTYPQDSHRLASVGGTARSYDSMGNTTAVGGTAREYVYDAIGRMEQTKQGGVVRGSYWYNGKGEQVRRQASTTTHFVYDEVGRLLGQYFANGAPLQQYLWLDDLPVGVIAGNQVRYVQPDHLGTPRSIIDPTRNVAIWTWDLAGEAFGDTLPNTNPDGDGDNFVYDLRFPGQRYDMASGLNYNYFRDYETGTGRYVQSDPVGLISGMSTYGYAAAAPLLLIDPLGLCYQMGYLFSPNCTAARPPPRAEVPGPFGPNCGTGSGASWIPDGYVAARFTAACQAHDNCYGTCGASKSSCDSKFFDDLRRACGGILNFSCYAVAYVYYSAVAEGPVPERAYSNAQEAACKDCKK
jgi:RHS repeat-associated protein